MEKELVALQASMYNIFSDKCLFIQTQHSEYMILLHLISSSHKLTALLLVIITYGPLTRNYCENGIGFLQDRKIQCQLGGEFFEKDGP